MDLRCIDVDIFTISCRHHTVIVDKTTSDLEENFNAINKEEDDDDEQKNGIATVEDAVKSVFVAEEICW